MSLEAHHSFMLNVMERQTNIARKLIMELENKNAALAAENERLRKAGDLVAEELIGCYKGEGYDPKDSDTLPIWNAAKEGRDAK